MLEYEIANHDGLLFKNLPLIKALRKKRHSYKKNIKRSHVQLDLFDFYVDETQVIIDLMVPKNYLEPMEKTVPPPKAKSNNVVGLIPRTKHPIIDFQFATYGMKEDQLFDFAIETYRRGYHSIGEVIQLDKEELLSMMKGNTETLTILEHHMAKIGLPICARAPSWTAPQNKNYVFGCVPD